LSLQIIIKRIGKSSKERYCGVMSDLLLSLHLKSQFIKILDLMVKISLYFKVFSRLLLKIIFSLGEYSYLWQAYVSLFLGYTNILINYLLVIKSTNILIYKYTIKLFTYHVQKNSNYTHSRRNIR